MLSFISNTLVMPAPLADVTPSTFDCMISDLEAMLNMPLKPTVRPVKVKLTKPVKVTTVASALPTLEHSNESYDFDIFPQTYRPLQAWLKARNIKASGSMDALRERAILFLDGDLSLVKAPKVKRVAKVKRSAFGLDYRKSQKMVSWFKAQCPSNLLPELVKNIGWDNVELNLDAILRTDWFRSMDTKQIKSMAQDCLLSQEMFDAFVEAV